MKQQQIDSDVHWSTAKSEKCYYSETGENIEERETAPDQPIRVNDTIFVSLRILQVLHVNGTSSLDVLLATVANEDWLPVRMNGHKQQRTKVRT